MTLFHPIRSQEHVHPVIANLSEWEKFFIVVTKEKKIVGPPGPTEWAPRRKEKEICKLRYVLVNV